MSEIKPQWETPAVLRLGALAQGSGQCSTGASNLGPCAAGSVDDLTTCEAGTGVV